MTRRSKAAVGTTLIAAILVGGANVLPSAAQQPPPPIATEFLTGRAAFTDDVDMKFKIRLNRKADWAGEPRHKGRRGSRHDRRRPRPVVVNVDDPSRTLVARFTVQPGAQFPWHSHPGPVVVTVTQGELVYVPADDCRERRYPAGTAFVDPGHGHVHTAVNRTAAPTVLVATFYESPAEGALLIPAEAPADCTV
jgi:quercetin dioxygenase-like cupin family protein